ncbi:hypothetical protein K7711_46395 [Nocardia sp. CA2R105]|uniref:hypothetical protein n=1 Tax=Nocardia coffeae TaxID=2873381 RepID=UPI001CA6DDDE|nr:hypothetical protein [Nocardia coffeae]MBY8863964.1 hypothetical protein [Nocardia coffeae]
MIASLRATAEKKRLIHRAVEYVVIATTATPDRARRVSSGTSENTLDHIFPAPRRDSVECRRIVRKTVRRRRSPLLSEAKDRKPVIFVIGNSPIESPAMP